MLKNLVQTSKSSVIGAIKATGIQDALTSTAVNTARNYSNTASTILSAKYPNIQQLAVSTGLSDVANSTATNLLNQYQPAVSATATAATAVPQITAPPQLKLTPFPVSDSNPIPREPVFPKTKVGASRIEPIVLGKVVEADLHHIGIHPHPFYKQKWFIVLIIVVVIGLIYYYKHKDDTNPNRETPGNPVY